MKKATRVVLVIATVAMTMSAVTCRQIPSYLMRVCKVYGRVTDVETLLPVEGVEVFVGTTLGNSEYSELTNSLGQYELELAEGTWTLSFEREGYGPWSVDVTVNERNAQRVEQNAFLDPFIPDIVGVWFGEHLLHNPEAQLYADFELTFRADSTFQGLSLVEDVLPRKLSGNPSSWGTYEVTSSTIECVVTSMCINYEYIVLDQPVSYSVPYSFSQGCLVGYFIPEVQWTLTRQ